MLLTKQYHNEKSGMEGRKNKVNKIPYFGLKVVKVKKEKNKCKHLNAPCIHTYIYNGEIRCPQCGKILTPEWLEKRIIIDPLLVKEEKKGNWVNGENLDEIKFPCFCSYSNDNEKGIGFFSKNNGYYYIANINFQKRTQEDISDGRHDLKAFITKNNIHILKGKIIIFENEEEK